MELKTGNMFFRMEKQENGYGFAVYRGEKRLYANEKPVRFGVRDVGGFHYQYQVPYDAVKLWGEDLIAEGTVTTEWGSVYRVQDKISVYHLTDSFLFKRRAWVVESEEDQGFYSRISFRMEEETDISKYDFFGPGQWYEQNKRSAGHFMGHDLTLDYHWYKETRFALPVLAMQNQNNRNTLVIAREKADIKPIDGTQPARQEPASRYFTVGSFGYSQPDGLSMDYVYPGTEGGDPRMFDPSAGNRGIWDILFPASPFRYFYHPAERGFAHEFSIIVQAREEHNFPDMMRDVFREYSAHYNHPIVRVDNKQLLDVSMELLDHYCRSWVDGEWGWPGAFYTATGQAVDIMHQMGFVGQQPGNAGMLIRYGMTYDKPNLIQKGKNVIQFWVDHSMMDWGLPNVWFNALKKPGNFRMDHPIFIRMLADGVENIIDSYVFLHNHGEEHEDWKIFCETTADWFVKNINEDGSWYRAYSAVDASVYHPSKRMTTSVIRFLVRMYLVTGKEAYKETAIKAGEWSYEVIYKGMEYTGGTCDNDDIQDKEAGIYAMFAFLALYDMTGEKKWLEACKGAADYTETWTLRWSYPVHPTIKPHAYWTRDISGQSIITSAGSHIDLYMAACSYTYYRLYLLTGDEHYKEFAVFCHNNPRQVTDVDGSIGYARKGLAHEANWTYDQVVGRAEQSVLFCTYIQIEPVLRMLDTFGVCEIEDAEKLPLEERLSRNRLAEHYMK